MVLERFRLTIINSFHTLINKLDALKPLFSSVSAHVPIVPTFSKTFFWPEPIFSANMMSVN